MTTTKQRRLAGAGLALSFSLALSGCAGFGNLGDEPGATTVTATASPTTTGGRSACSTSASTFLSPCG